MKFEVDNTVDDKLDLIISSLETMVEKVEGLSEYVRLLNQGASLTFDETQSTGGK